MIQKTTPPDITHDYVEERDGYESRGLTTAPVYGEWGTHASYYVNPEQALRLSTVYACARIISEAVSILPVHVHDEISPEETARNYTHPVNRLFNLEMNADMTAAVGTTYLTNSLMLTGNCLAEIDFDAAGRVSAMWPFDPRRVWSTVRSNGGEIIYGVIGNPRLETGFFNDYQSEEINWIPASRIFHVPLLGNGRWGLSPIGMNRVTLEVAEGGEAFNKRVYDQGVYLGGTLTTPEKLEKKSRQNIAESWREAYGGRRGHQKTAILDRGMKYEQLQVPANDAFFLESRRFQDKDIAKIFRVPLYMLNDLKDGASYASIDAIRREFYKLNISGVLRALASEIRRKLIRDARQSVRFDQDGVLRGSIEERYDAYQKALGGGSVPAFASPNQIRRIEGWAPVEGGDALYVPLNTQEMGAAGEAETGGDGASEGDGEVDAVNDVERGSASVPASMVRNLQVAAQRVVDIEAGRAQRHAKKDSKAFVSWANQYYAQATDLGVEALRSAVEVIAEHLERDEPEAVRAVQVFLDQHNATHARAVIAAHDDGELHELAEVWKAQGARQMTDSILSLLGVSK